MIEEFDPYQVRIKGVLVDPCAIGEAYKMSPTLFQSVKKLLRIGKKHKSEAEDVYQAVTSIFRWVDIHMDDNPELEDFFDKVKKEIEESHFR